MQILLERGSPCASAERISLGGIYGLLRPWRAWQRSSSVVKRICKMLCTTALFGDSLGALALRSPADKKPFYFNSTFISLIWRSGPSHPSIHAKRPTSISWNRTYWNTLRETALRRFFLRPSCSTAFRLIFLWTRFGGFKGPLLFTIADLIKQMH